MGLEALPDGNITDTSENINTLTLGFIKTSKYNILIISFMSIESAKVAIDETPHCSDIKTRGPWTFTIR